MYWVKSMCLILYQCVIYFLVSAVVGSSGSTGAVIGGAIGRVVVIVVMIIIVVILLVLIYMQQLHQKKSYLGITDTISDGKCT